MNTENCQSWTKSRSLWPIFDMWHDFVLRSIHQPSFKFLGQVVKEIQTGGEIVQIYGPDEKVGHSDLLLACDTFLSYEHYFKFCGPYSISKYNNVVIIFTHWPTFDEI